MEGDLTLVCTGDLHLGRHPTRIPADLDGHVYSPRTVWQSTVQEAIDQNVDAVVITGDIVDRENRFFEAFGALEDGITQLSESNIPVLVVAGNHDFDVLPRMVGDMDFDGLHLLGENSNWERWTLEDPDGPRLHIDGWSFSDSEVLYSPVSDYDLKADPDVPVMGILHADIEAQGSTYAPVDRSELRSSTADAWLLGHIHAPNILRDSEPFVIYPGSPQPLDPGETGPHGPWLLTVGSDGDIEANQLPLATIRYDRLTVDVADIEEYTAVATRVSDRVSDHIREAVSTGTIELFLSRIQLRGRTPVHGELVEERKSIQTDLSLREGTVPVRVEKLDIDTRPAIDLDELSAEESPTGYLASLLQSMGEGAASEEYEDLVEEATAAMQDAYHARTFDELRREDRLALPSEDDALDVLEQQAKLLLDMLLAQKEGGP